MQPAELIRSALQLSDDLFTKLVEGLRDHPLVRSSGERGNHALWTLGHLAVVEGGVPTILFGEPNPVAHWEPLFEPGTLPDDDASRYPSFDELLRTLRGLRAMNIATLDRLGAADLDRRPANVPPGFESIMHTFGHTLQVVAMHQMIHAGQVMDMRRVAGLERVIL